MTAYQGGKKRLGKQVAEVIKKVEREHGKENIPKYGMNFILILKE